MEYIGLNRILDIIHIGSAVGTVISGTNDITNYCGLVERLKISDEDVSDAFRKSAKSNKKRK